ncbi:hypothetical protein GCM10018954_000960 [Kutzneria kofuensis]
MLGWAGPAADSLADATEVVTIIDAVTRARPVKARATVPTDALRFCRGRPHCRRIIRNDSFPFR